MTIHVRNKGHSGEREICHKLQHYLDKNAHKSKAHKTTVVQRNVDQVRDGGADIITVRPFAIEVKRQERLLLKQWWKQSLSQVTKKNPVPVLVYRMNRRPWRVIVPSNILLKKRYHIASPNKTGIEYTIEISWELFMVILDSKIIKS